MTPTPELRRRRLTLMLLAVSVLTVANGRDRPVIGTLSLSLDLGRAPRVEAALAPALAVVASVVADTVQRLIR